MLELKLPLKNAVVSLQTDEQESFLKNEEHRKNLDGSFSFKWYDLERAGTDCTLPAPVSFVWEETGEPASENEGYYYLLVSESGNMQDPWVYITKQCSYDVYNLKVGTKYYWCVQKNGKRSEISSFQTLLTLPRCMKIDNISNVRDMGGYKVEEGQIRQGLLYRGGEFELHMQLTPDGVKELQRLSIRTELDMRGEAKDKVDFTTSEAIGVKRAYIPSVPYAQVFKKEQRSAVKNFFRVLADHRNYPIYYHCWGGADRTGTFAFILGAFLGMRFEDLIDEYEFTSLSIWGIRSRNYEEFREFLNQFMELPGKTPREKSTAFLRDYIGLTDKQLAVIYNTLVRKDL